MTSLGSLPEDVKRLICAELAESQHVRSLWQVCKSWRMAAEPFLYRGLEWTVNYGDGPSTGDDVKKILEDEVANKYLEHARNLFLSTTWNKIPSTSSSDESESESEVSPEKADKFANWSGLCPVRSSTTLSEPIYPHFGEVFVADSKIDQSERERVWSPLVSTLSKFKHLTDIVVEGRSGLPPGLLSAIEQHHPSCRLHLRKFRFKSLHEDATDPDERALATSENLHSLSIMYVYRDSNGVDDHNAAAALRTVALAKNLKHVRMLGCRPAGSVGLARARDRPLEQWKGFVPPIEEDETENQNTAKTNLESLSFVCYSSSLTVAKLEKWEQVADLSSLKTLCFSTGDKDFLSLVAAEGKFPHLEDLTMTLEPRKEDNLEGWQTALEQFFASLPPLSSLSLSGTLHAALMDIIVGNHGKTLENLSLRPYDDGYDMPGPPLRITAPIMEILASKARKLTSLNLTLRRSMGDRTETRCYEALGTLENLKKVKLGLDCSNGNEWNLEPHDDWDDFDKETQTPAGQQPKSYNGYLKIAIVNSALDEGLVKQIWDVINEKREKDRLQTLEIHTYGGSSFDRSHPGDLMDIVEHVSRHYTVTAQAEAENGIEIVELSKKEREERDASQRKDEQEMFEKWGDRGEPGGSYKVLKHLWPYEKGEDWRTKWRSWPLQRALGEDEKTDEK